MFFNRDFVGGLLDVVSMKRFQFVETDLEFFVCFFSPPKWSLRNALTPPDHPLPPLEALVVLILYCFYRRHNADVENM